MPLPGTFCRITYVMQDTDNDVGWTETYFKAIPGSPTPAIGWQDAVLAALGPFTLERAALLVGKSQIDFIKISDDGFKGDVVTYVQAPLTGLFPSGTGQLGGPLDAALMSFNDDTGKYNGRKFYHGFPVNQFTSRQWTPTPSGVANLNSFNASLAGSGLCLKAITKPAAIPPVIGYFPIVRAVVTRLTGHRVGRPFDYLRGRRRIA
jgi:hypothetical protein